MNRNKKRALVALLVEPTVQGAAKAAGLGRRTIYRYLDDPEFKRELRARQDQAIRAATAVLAGLTGEAIAVLRDTMHDAEATVASRVRAALGLLEHQTRMQIQNDMLERLDALEAHVGGKR